MKITVVCEHNASMDSEEGKGPIPRAWAYVSVTFSKKRGTK